MARLFVAGFILLATPVAAMAACAPLKLPPAGSKRSDIVAAVMPAVVQVQARFGPDTNESYEEVLGDAMRETQASNRQSQGSGFIVSGDGLVVTNEHVVAQATQITVRLADGSTRGATLIGSDERTDVALLRMEALARCYPALIWGQRQNPRRRKPNRGRLAIRAGRFGIRRDRFWPRPITGRRTIPRLLADRCRHQPGQ